MCRRRHDGLVLLAAATFFSTVVAPTMGLQPYRSTERGETTRQPRAARQVSGGASAVYQESRARHRSVVASDVVEPGR
uniref:Putative secreted protein n=1 Tax=Amblyomma cajennense TaxID=34607 RepID=A0A023FDF2_AMBCJ